MKTFKNFTLITIMLSIANWGFAIAPIEYYCVHASYITNETVVYAHISGRTELCPVYESSDYWIERPLIANEEKFIQWGARQDEEHELHAFYHDPKEPSCRGGIIPM